MAASKSPTKMVTVRLNSMEIEKLEDLERVLGKSTSEVLRICIDEIHARYCIRLSGRPPRNEEE